MKIYVIRHGETMANKDGLLQGQSEFDINELGVMLAEITGREMKEIKFDAAFSSPLSRAKRTAEIILKESGNSGVDIAFDNRLKEINMGEYELKKFRPEEAEVPIEWAKGFFDNPLLVEAAPGGESLQKLIGRTGEFLREMARECVAAGCENALVSTHGCAMRGMLNFMYEDSSDFWQGGIPLNCSVNIIETDGEKFGFVERDKVYYSEEYVFDRYKI